MSLQFGQFNSVYNFNKESVSVVSSAKSEFLWLITGRTIEFQRQKFTCDSFKRHKIRAPIRKRGDTKPDLQSDREVTFLILLNQWDLALT